MAAISMNESQADMGQGEEEAKNKKRVQILERGEIIFFYRPKVEKEEVHGLEDVQRFYLVLRPQQGKDKQEGPSPPLRLMLMGRKALPDPDREPSKKSRPYWGLVEMATTDVQVIKAALKGREYDTATRGHRHQPPCRAAGEGVYMILNHTHTHTHTHLVYKLQYPKEEVEGEPQEAFNIAREASFVIQIKNPDQPPPTNNNNNNNNKQQKKKKTALFPAHLQGVLGKRRYHPADPPEFLNHEGCEFLLISSPSDHVEEEMNTEEHHECPDPDLLIQTFNTNTVELDDVSLRPLFQGTWD